MRWDDLPESKMVADRRGKPFRKKTTLREMREETESEPQPERGAPDPTSDVAKRLGVDDVDKV